MSANDERPVTAAQAQLKATAMHGGRTEPMKIIETVWDPADGLTSEEIMALRRASGWLPTGGVAEATELSEDEVFESLSLFGPPKLDQDGSYFRWNWVYEWAQGNFDAEVHVPQIQQIVDGILEDVGDLDQAMSIAVAHLRKLYATEVVEAVLGIEA